MKGEAWTAHPFPAVSGMAGGGALFRPLPLSLPASPGVTLVSGGEEAGLTLEPPPVVESERRRGIELFLSPGVAEATGERKQDTSGSSGIKASEPHCREIREIQKTCNSRVHSSNKESLNVSSTLGPVRPTTRRSCKARP